MIYAENVLLCIAVPLVISMLFNGKIVRRFIISFLTGMIVCLLSAYISGYLAVATVYGAEDTSIFLSPIVEEIMKFLPVLFCLFVFEPSDEDLKMTAIGVGSGFATFENCCFILSSGAQNLGYILIRGSAVGVMHLVTMQAFVMGVRILKRYKVISLAGIMGALSMSMTFHGLYNLLVSKPGASSYIGYALPIHFAILLYLIDHRSDSSGGEMNL